MTPTVKCVPMTKPQNNMEELKDEIQEGLKKLQKYGQSLENLAHEMKETIELIKGKIYE